MRIVSSLTCGEHAALVTSCALVAAGVYKTKDKSRPNKPAASPEVGHGAPLQPPHSAKSDPHSRSGEFWGWDRFPSFLSHNVLSSPLATFNNPPPPLTHSSLQFFRPGLARVTSGLHVSELLHPEFSCSGEHRWASGRRAARPVGGDREQCTGSMSQHREGNLSCPTLSPVFYVNLVRRAAVIVNTNQ